MGACSSTRGSCGIHQPGFSETSVHIGSCSQRGRHPGGAKEQQDRWCVRQALGATLFGIFDGHGPSGHFVADYVETRLPKSMLQLREQPGADMAAELPRLFEDTQRKLLENPYLGSDDSGTTVTVVLHDSERHTLTLAHVGDSRAVMVRSASQEGKVEAVDLTRDHNPSLLAEKRRIEQAGGRVASVAGVKRVLTKSSSNLSGSGLNMTRSLGDGLAHANCGISAVPEVSTYQLQACDRILLVCSDGIWSVMSTQEAADIVSAFRPDQADAAARKLVDKAWSKWVRSTNGTKVDDITVTVAFLPLVSDVSMDCASTAEPSSPCPSFSSY